LRQLQSIYITIAAISLGAGILYALSLVFSRTRKNAWLQTTGILLFIVGGLTIYSFVLSINLRQGEPNRSVLQLRQWIVLANSFVPIPLILLFIKEGHLLTAAGQPTSENKTPGILFFVGFAAAVTPQSFKKLSSLTATNLS